VFEDIVKVHGFIPDSLILGFWYYKCIKYNSQCSAVQISIFKCKFTWSR